MKDPRSQGCGPAKVTLYYRKKADEAFRQASSAGSADFRASYLTLGRSYQDMATTIEEIVKRQSRAGKIGPGG